jgi:hypothetical protein
LLVVGHVGAGVYTARNMMLPSRAPCDLPRALSRRSSQSTPFTHSGGPPSGERSGDARNRNARAPRRCHPRHPSLQIGLPRVAEPLHFGEEASMGGEDNRLTLQAPAQRSPTLTSSSGSTFRASASLRMVLPRGSTWLRSTRTMVAIPTPERSASCS